MLGEVLQETLYLSLHTDDPGEDGESEIEGGSYERQAVNFAMLRNLTPEARSEELVQFSNMPSATITHLGLWDEDDNFLWPGQLVDENNQPIAKRFFAGDRAEFPVGDLIAMFED